jgi:hypothetical protein
MTTRTHTAATEATSPDRRHPRRRQPLLFVCRKLSAAKMVGGGGVRVPSATGSSGKVGQRHPGQDRHCAGGGTRQRSAGSLPPRECTHAGHNLARQRLCVCVPNAGRASTPLARPPHKARKGYKREPLGVTSCAELQQPLRACPHTAQVKGLLAPSPWRPPSCENLE